MNILLSYYAHSILILYIPVRVSLILIYYFERTQCNLFDNTISSNISVSIKLRPFGIKHFYLLLRYLLFIYRAVV